MRQKMKAIMAMSVVVMLVGLLMLALPAEATRGTMTVTTLDPDTPITYTLSAVTADGDAFANNGDVIVLVYNGRAETINVTFTTPYQPGGFDLADLSATVQTTSTKVFGPFNPQYFNQSAGTVYVDYNASASVTAAAFKLP